MFRKDAWYVAAWRHECVAPSVAKSIRGTSEEHPLDLKAMHRGLNDESRSQDRLRRTS